MAKSRIKRIKRTGLVFISALLICMTGCGQEQTQDNSSSSDSGIENIEENASENTNIDELLQTARDAYYGTKEEVRDHERAFELYSKILELDDTVGEAYYYQGRIYEEKYDYENAVSCYEKGIEHGSEYSRMALGFLYRNGNGKQQSYKEARALFEQAIENGCVEANAGMGDFYQSGNYDVVQDGELAVDYFLEASKGTEPEWVAYAFNSLGTIYREGQDVLFDYEKAIDYYTKARNALGYGSLAKIALTYQKKIYDPDKAKEYYSQALDEYERESEAGVSDSMRAIGFAYEQGNGVEKDISKAIEWYEKSADLGNRLATYWCLSP